MFKAFGKYAQREGLDAGDGFIPVRAVAHDARKSRYFGDPASVGFALEFDREGHGVNVPPGQLSHKRLHPTAAVRDPR